MGTGGSIKMSEEKVPPLGSTEALLGWGVGRLRERERRESKRVSFLEVLTDS
jgi:hypothetical protein